MGSQRSSVSLLHFNISRDFLWAASAPGIRAAPRHQLTELRSDIILVPFKQFLWKQSHAPSWESLGHPLRKVRDSHTVHATQKKGPCGIVACSKRSKRQSILSYSIPLESLIKPGWNLGFPHGSSSSSKISPFRWIAKDQRDQVQEAHAGRGVGLLILPGLETDGMVKVQLMYVYIYILHTYIYIYVKT